MKILMCDPLHFDVNYEINVWMDKQISVDRENARRQYINLRNTYKNLAVEVIEVDQKVGLPDMVYSANFGFVNNRDFIKANFYHKERRPEADHSAEMMAELGYNVKKLPQDVFFEGQGDLFKAEGKFFCGYGFRTSERAKPYLEEILKSEVLMMKLVDPRWYHMDISFFPLGEGRVFIIPKAFDKVSLEIIHREFADVIETNDIEDITGFACNSYLVGKNIVTNKISKNSRKQLEARGYNLMEVDVSEFLKGGGSVRCLTLDI